MVTEQGTSQRGCAAELAAGQVSLRWSARCDTARVFWCVGAAEPGAGASPSGGGCNAKGSQQTADERVQFIPRQGKQQASAARTVGCESSAGQGDTAEYSQRSACTITLL